MSHPQGVLLRLRTQPLDAVALRLSVLKPHIAVGIVLWFALSISPTWLPTPDSALYLMLGRSLAEGHGYALDNQPHAYLPPGYPLLLAAFDRVGLGSMWCLNLMMAVIGLLTVWVSYRLVSEIASQQVALLVAGLLGCNSLLHGLSAVELSDVPFTLLVLTGLYGMLRGLRGERWALEWGTLTILASCWVRVAGVALAVGCALAIVLQPRSTPARRVVTNAVALVVGAAATLGLFYGRYQQTLRAEHLLPPASYMAAVDALVSAPPWILLGRTLKNVYDSAADMPRFLFGLKLHPLPVLAVILVPALVGVWRRLVRREFLILLAVASYGAGIVVNLPAGARYLLPIAPLLILFYLEGFSAVLNWNPRIRNWSYSGLFGLVVALVALNAIEGLHSTYKNHREVAATHAALTETADCLRTHAAAGERFLGYSAEPELAYLSRVPYLQLDRCQLACKMSKDEYLRFLFDQHIRLVVLKPGEESRLADEKLIRDAVRDRQLFQQVADTGSFHIYRFIAPPTVAKTAASDQPQPR